MLVFIFCIQLTGFYLLYSTSARAVFVKRKMNTWLYTHRRFSKVTGSLMLLTSFVLFLLELGTSVGSLFALISLMTISGFTIVLLPLQKPASRR